MANFFAGHCTTRQQHSHYVCTISTIFYSTSKSLEKLKKNKEKI
jgi:hypothetical protein